MSNALPVLTEEDIDRLEPSRILDARIVRNVLHLKITGEAACYYSTNLEAAWGVIEYLIRDDFRVNLTHDATGWHCVFETRLIDGTTGHYESGPTPTAPLAICRAALKAAKAE